MFLKVNIFRLLKANLFSYIFRYVFCRSLCQKFPRKHNVLMNFLSGILRDEGGFEYKKAIVDTIINTIEDSPDGKEAGMFMML